MKIGTLATKTIIPSSPMVLGWSIRRLPAYQLVRNYFSSSYRTGVSNVSFVNLTGTPNVSFGLEFVS